ncbi:MAG: exonuclease SbcCD subunit D [Clostridia bacterium]|nr:exonuclease SbcCD subunit D [Clostridia bacterium]
MKFIHVSDLHIGKRLNEYSLIEDQKYILNEIINVIKEEAPDCVFIAGDVYDKSVPSAEAVSLLDLFLGKLAQTGAKVFIISGNHDSAERIAYGTEAFKKQGIYISPVFDGTISKCEMNDEYGRVNVYLLPFIKPAHVKRYAYPNGDKNDPKVYAPIGQEVESYTEAVDAVVKSLGVNEKERNIILAHQFVTGAERCDSEEVTVGGLDNVEGFVFDPFDYVALGHIHKSQKIKRETMRYSGTPLKYSASEATDTKSVIVGEIREKGNVEIREIPLMPLRDFIDIKGKLDDILKSENKKDFVRITLTDEDAVVDAYGKLKINYPFMTELLFERKYKADFQRSEYREDKSESEKFFDFYRMINGKELTDEQYKIAGEIIEDIKGGRA